MKRCLLLKPYFACLLSVFCLLSLAAVATAAYDSESQYEAYGGETRALALTGLLYEFDLYFDEFLDLVAGLADDEYPHFLVENADRYDAFQRLHPDISFCAIIAFVNVNVDLGFYYYIENVPNPYAVYALVNKHFTLPPDWEPYDFESIGHGHRLRAEAAEQFLLMRDAISEDGMRLAVISSFRSYQTQRNTHSRGVRRSGLESADRQFARAGHSEHQSGLAVDILHRTGYSFMTQARFENRREFEWLLDNAHNFGFILRYPYEYTHIHGYIFEPWHWRFVGVDIATAMHSRGIVLLEDFYGRYLAAGVLERVRQYLLAPSETEVVTAVVGAFASFRGRVFVR